MRQFYLLATTVLLLVLGTTTHVCATDTSTIPAPAPVPYDVMATYGNKAECISVGTVARNMLISQSRSGGRVLALAQGMDQAFSDQWRRLAHLPPTTVKVVLAHGFPIDDDPSGVAIDTVEFNEQGCAISKTFLKGTVWDTILHGVAKAMETKASATNNSI